MSNLRQRRRVKESPEQRETELAAQRKSTKRRRVDVSQEQLVYNCLAFWYCPSDDYSLSRDVHIGTTSEFCPYCKALKFNGETMETCYASGKVKLPQIAASPEPLRTLLTGYASESKRFFFLLSNIRKYNSCYITNDFFVNITNDFVWCPNRISRSFYAYFQSERADLS